ncbi:MAG: hypothetical protein QG602_2422 [Verrucomicrobiota bacterium]|nr:hypothetical protein [Verrucomicrobiota bacterium]
MVKAGAKRLNRTCFPPKSVRIFADSQPRLMTLMLRPASLAWLTLVVLSALWLGQLNSRRIAQIEKISSQAEAAPAAADSPTGHLHGTRARLLPVGSARSQAVIMDVQKMAATNSWTVARADYDNAPEGRAVHGPAPYRWWLRLVALAEPGAPGPAVERAALHADPALLLLLAIGAGLFTAWRFGAVAGGFLALGLSALFSHAQLFTPGRPDTHGLFLAANLVGLLLLLAAWQRPSRIGLFLAGAAGGLGCWLDAGSQLAVLGAVLTGGLVALRFSPRPPAVESAPLPWRAWALGGGIVGLTGWWLEGRPGGISGAGLDANHPLLVPVWFGLAEILLRVQRRPWREAQTGERLALIAGGLAVLLPLAWLFHRGTGGAEFGPDHPDLAGRGGLFAWVRADRLSLGLTAALLPLLLIPAALRLMRGDAARRPVILFAVGSAGVCLLLVFWSLRWWGLLDVMLLGLLAATAAATLGGFAAIGWRSGLGLLLLPALIAAWPRPVADEELAPAEARALVERDLAQWLAARSEPGTIAFAPPALSASLSYYGGLRVVASPYPGNNEGLALAARIAGTASTDEAQALIQQRGIQYVVLPSWDDALDRLAQAGSATPERSLIVLLRQWLPPRWLRPVAYQLPVIPGLETDTLAVFEVVEPQENAIALSRLAEYFVDTGRLELAAAVGDSLEQSFAADAGAMIARAKVALARKENRTLARIMPELLPAIADGRDEDLPWERRANLAIVLAQTKHPELARAQVEFCLGEADTERLRALGPIGLYRLLTLARAFRVEFSDPALRTTALALLPVEFQAQLQP